MKTFSKYIQKKILDEEKLEGLHSPAIMPHSGPAGGLGIGFGPEMPRAMHEPYSSTDSTAGLSRLKPHDAELWETLVWSTYAERWPNDRYGNLINRNLTFADLALSLDLFISPFDVIGTDNPKVVKKILQILAEILGLSYKEINRYRPQSNLFSDYDNQIDELSQRIGVFLAPKH